MRAAVKRGVSPERLEWGLARFMLYIGVTCHEEDKDVPLKRKL